MQPLHGTDGGSHKSQLPHWKKQQHIITHFFAEQTTPLYEDHHNHISSLNEGTLPLAVPSPI
jgi:hypothetical protein